MITGMDRKIKKRNISMKFKLVQITLSILGLLGIIFLLPGCSGSTGTTPVGDQTITVQRGSISIVVTGTGNLVLKDKNNLSFGQTGLVSAQKTVKVAAVDVVDGQIVEKDQILVQADTTDWQKDITSAQHNLDLKQSILLQSQISLETAQYNLNAQTDVKAIQDKIDDANTKIQQALINRQEASRYSDSSGVQYWDHVIFSLRVDIAQYNLDLKDMLEDPAHSGAATSVADIKSKQNSVELAQAQVINSQNDLEDAQTMLDDVKNSAQTIKAPYKGLITRVGVSLGDIVSRSANLIEIAQIDKFEALVVVTQRDVTSLVRGNDATAVFDAVPDLTFPAIITRIAPTGVIQQGVVTYQVTIELTSIEPNKGVAATSAVTTPLVLKEGFSAVVNMPIQEKDNILIVPSKAIIHQGQDYVVQVQTGTVTETRIVKIGITDYQNTEILEGLSEGDKIVLPVIPTATPSSSGLFGEGKPDDKTSRYC
jgi:multidrug efflux pump subunit AcrA (membrane-fusion protein)